MTEEHQLTIETPEQVALDYQIAGIGSRFMAFAIDTLYQALIFALVLLILAFTMPTIEKYLGRLGEDWTIAITIFFFFGLYWGYFAFFEAIWKGQTPGKRNVAIRVVKDSGRSINTFEAVSRNLLRSIDQLPGIYVFGLVSMAVSKENRRIGDFVAGTLVVHEKSAIEIDADLQDLSHSTAYIMSTAGLTATDLEVIETFLHRRLTLEEMVRSQMADRIIAHLGTKITITPDPGQSPEQYLEVVAKAIRDNRHS
jgi:uncharacterized RDD family membrane protein YckC